MVNRLLTVTQAQNDLSSTSNQNNGQESSGPVFVADQALNHKTSRQEDFFSDFVNNDQEFSSSERSKFLSGEGPTEPDFDMDFDLAQLEPAPEGPHRTEVNNTMHYMDPLCPLLDSDQYRQAQADNTHAPRGWPNAISPVVDPDQTNSQPIIIPLRSESYSYLSAENQYGRNSNFVQSSKDGDFLEASKLSETQLSSSSGSSWANITAIWRVWILE